MSSRPTRICASTACRRSPHRSPPSSRRSPNSAPDRGELAPARSRAAGGTRAGNTTQFNRVEAPMGDARADHRLHRPGAQRPVVAKAKPDSLVFVRDTGGNEQRQLYRLDPGAKEPVLLTDRARTRRSAHHPRARLVLLGVHRPRQDRQARESDDRRHAARSARSGARAQARDASRHRLGRVRVLRSTTAASR